ncbi:hypothetical protein Kpol_2002p66 [Vanderwaltozyma polyspora DSM 70294]|uniref:Protein CASP n=1 Tax=Vanderwaltozyma polyspora (strain ATCC 22028 / DSM 70294 / BCRC 21397 / CBS 2163 / NBRC 10782 / NRRL Y-8283 / UCD 57-17) TaxID=436907 RepID=A7TFI1_VANPO|nr:uncharacterized protein Kpol_2002p66 [Vanderwaltozyma polyspora DSM 70294]EDO18995.1 hypothetical protein Kpol_2002p66 [Vanderwaltozyma polyspora DSM 70294]
MDTSVYNHALELWTKADLSGLQKQLDDDVLEVKEKETNSLGSRKILAAETKKFKKLPTDEKLGQVNKIIKQYQQEIDDLTKRSQFCESILINIYAKLSETPDPKPLLQNSIDKFQNIEDSAVLKEKVDDLQDKLAKYADYESLKSRLLDLEQSSAEVLSKRLSAQEKELTSVWEAKQKNWNEKESEITKQLEILKANNKVLETKISKQIDLDEGQDSQDQSTSSDGSKFVNVSESNFLIQELESAQSRVFQLEKRNEELTSSLAKATNSAEKESELLAKEVKISQLESENALLSASVERERASHEKVQTTSDEKYKLSKAELESYKSELETVRRKLNNFSDYNQIKDELTALKKIEFGVEDATSDDELELDQDNLNKNKMENTLISANKKLQSNLAELRAKDVGKTEEIKALKDSISKLNANIADLEKLNAKLEIDLEKVEDIDQKFNDAASMRSGATRQIHNRVGGGGKLSPTSSIVGIPEESELPSLVNNNSILPIVTKQRDRFRTRNMELEKQLRQFNTEKAKLRAELSKLQADNQKLSDRSRFTSSYKGSSSSSEINYADADVEAQISKNFEDSLNPLIDVKKKESEYYKTHRLPITERLFMKFANIVSSSRTSRAIFIFYSLGIHGVLIVLLMYFANSNPYTPSDLINTSNGISSGLEQAGNIDIGSANAVGAGAVAGSGSGAGVAAGMAGKAAGSIAGSNAVGVNAGQAVGRNVVV